MAGKQAVKKPAAKKKPVKKAASKKPAVKKPAAKKPVKTDPPEVVEPGIPARSLVRTDDEVDAIITERVEYGELWQQAWQMDSLGVPLRVIAQKMDRSPSTVAKYIRKHLEVMEGDPTKAEQRASLLATLDLATQRMLGELTALEARQQGLEPEDRAPVWLGNSKPLLEALALRWKIAAPREAARQVTVELGAATASGGGMPEALATLVAKVQVTDTEAA